MDGKKMGRVGSRKLYAAGVAGLVMLLVFSFFVPQLIFSFRDSYLCKDIVHEEQENMDVTLLSAAYEPALGRRLTNFAEGQEKGRNYYVSSMEMPVTQELYQQLNSDSDGLRQQVMLAAMLDLGMLSYAFMGEYTVNCWKQYVIYSDEYTEGVNFIIWYLDIEAANGERLELLMDAEDATLYGIYAERNTLLTADTVSKLSTYGVELIGADLVGYFEKGHLNLDEWWYFSSYYYQSISQETLDNYINGQSDTLKIDGAPYQTYDEVVTIQSLENAWKGGEALDSPDTNTFILHLLFPGQSLDFSVRFFREENAESGSDEDTNYYLYPEAYMGIDPICRLIPEFSERF